jgi:hypothetical protein
MRNEQNAILIGNFMLFIFCRYFEKKRKNDPFLSVGSVSKEISHHRSGKLRNRGDTRRGRGTIVFPTDEERQTNCSMISAVRIENNTS